MNVATIQAEKWQVGDAIAEYNAAVRRREHNAQDLSDAERLQLREDRATLKALRAIRRGQKVLNLFDAMSAAGCKADGTPALGIARADWQRVTCARMSHHATEEQIRFSLPGQTWWATKRNRIDVPHRLLPEIVFPKSPTRLEATVPQIPPRHRPDVPLDRFHILFDAEWDRTAPVDPLLLRHIDGPLFVVLAVWELSAVERAVLGMRQ